MGGNSDTNNEVKNTTNTYNQTWDQKQLDYSNHSTTNLDLSNRSTSSFTQNTSVDTSNRSTNNTTNHVTSTDLGAISGALSVAKDSINAGANGLNILAVKSAEINRDSLDYGVRITNSAFEAIGKNQHITDDLVKNAQELAKYTSNSVAEIAAKAGSQVSDAWKNAKDAQDGKSLGDMKPIAIAVIGVFALMAFKKG
ncbi:hypothetical protein [Janthinobacterium sp. B9-8]|uniref:hypothetical protein n=1 Tax=Janthinobacterium sp. B9-8 TaxID=1236179 RepID=UPI00061CFD1F|nr:hypothetical protein [Janthinobacterium sp. B9-8]AMC34234.1 hypothetical protein VN23_06305 [Janthinobacterium sp. B9-8]